MTYIAASRDALERALRSCRVEDGSPAPLFREGDIGHIAHQIIASGVVVAADSLADDEALVKRVRSVQEGWFGPNLYGQPEHPDRYFGGAARLVLHQIAPALTERAQ